MADSDEFYYSNDVDVTKEKQFEDFHFIDFLPMKSFNQEDDWRWCVQPWYYKRIDAFRAAIGPDKILCMWCKRVYFPREAIDRQEFYIDDLQRHSCETHGLGRVCKEINFTKDWKQLLLDNTCCFHLSVPDKKSLIENQINQGFGRESGEINFDLNYDNFDELEFEADFVQTNFPIVTINFLKQFWKNNLE